jgi:hypothetical protein
MWLSTLITSAPKSASIMEQKGPGRSLDKSKTLMPVSVLCTVLQPPVHSGKVASSSTAHSARAPRSFTPEPCLPVSPWTARTTRPQTKLRSPLWPGASCAAATRDSCHWAKRHAALECDATRPANLPRLRAVSAWPLVVKGARRRYEGTRSSSLPNQEDRNLYLTKQL